jgi:NAD-dependent deacetylase
MVQPAASLPIFASQNGAVVIEINPRKTPLTPYANYSFQDTAGEVLPELVEKVWNI